MALIFDRFLEEPQDSEVLEVFLERLERERDALSREWARQVSLSSPRYKGIEIRDLEGSAGKAFDSFLEILRRNDFEPIDRFIEWLTRKRTRQGISFTELQQSFSKLRYILFDFIHTQAESGAFIKLLPRINLGIDWIVFRFSLYFRKFHEQKLRDYANSLEDKAKKRTAELEESKKNYQDLFNEISDGCFVWQEGKIVLANKGFCEMHGCDIDKALESPYRSFIADDFVDTVTKRFFSVLGGKPASDCFVYFRKQKSGKRMPTEAKSKRIQYDGRCAVLVLCSDITKRLELEEKLRQQDRFALIGSLTTSIAHEIRNPLSAIKVNTQILLDRLHLSGNDQRRLEISYEQLSHLEKTISQMLDYSKPIKLNYTICDIHQTIDYALDLLQKKMDESGIEVIKKYDISLPDVMLDKERIVASILNILNNAIDAMAEIDCRKTIWIQTTRHVDSGKRFIWLSIKDNGTGIAAEDRNSVFEPFFTKGKADGIGLGLSIVRKVLEAHRGNVCAKERPGGGADFTFVIPINLF